MEFFPRRGWDRSAHGQAGATWDNEMTFGIPSNPTQCGILFSPQISPKQKKKTELYKYQQAQPPLGRTGDQHGIGTIKKEM